MDKGRRGIGPLLLAGAMALTGCGEAAPVAAERYVATDRLATQMLDNLGDPATITVIADIDHSRLAFEAGSVMGPSRVLLLSEPTLESRLVATDPRIGLDLPFRILAFESPGDARQSKVIWNDFGYLASRYELTPDVVATLGPRYEALAARVTAGLPEEAIRRFADDTMQPSGIVTLESPYAADETLRRIRDAIGSQEDVLSFGEVDFQENARALGVATRFAHLLLFGAPGPGGAAMVDAPSLGLDGFCQKLLVWEDAAGDIFVSFNDLPALARRQQVDGPLALRVINFRLEQLFAGALAD